MTGAREMARRRRRARERSEARSHRLAVILLAAILSALALLAAILYSAWQLYEEARAFLPETPAAHVPIDRSISYLDRSGERALARLAGATAEDSAWLPLADMPPALVAATRWQSGESEEGHSAANPLVLAWQLARGRYWDLLPPAPGISGILARTQFADQNADSLPAERTRQWALAAALRARFSQDELLEWLLNRASFGEGIYGITAAAQAYFDRPVDQLKPALSVQLAALMEAGAAESFAAEYEVLLLAMHENGVLNGKDLAEARAAGPLQPSAAQPTIHAGDAQFIALARAQAQRILSDHGYKTRAAFATGLEIITSLDLQLQEVAQSELSRLLDSTTAEAGSPDEGALAIIDIADGSIRALAGAAFAETAPPAPLLLPFLYLESLRGTSGPPAHAATMLLDIPATYAHPHIAGLRMDARNADDEFRGPLLLADALRELRAVPAYEAVGGIPGMTSATRVAGRLGLTSLEDETAHPALLTDGGGVSALDMAYAYATIAGRGVMRGLPAATPTGAERPHEPLAILAIRNRSGEILWQLDASSDSTRSDILAPELADWLIALLGEGAGQLRLAGASGPSASARSGAWQLLLTPERSVALHLRRADGAHFSASFPGNNTAVDALYRIAAMGEVSRAWPKSDLLVERAVCEISGGLANGVCPERLLPFLAGATPQTVDTRWQLLWINDANGLLASDATPLERRSERIYFSPPERAIPFWLASGRSLQPAVADTPLTADSRLRLLPFPEQAQSGDIMLRGWLEHDGLSQLRLEYGAGATPDEWLEIATLSEIPQAAENGPPYDLFRWDAAGLNGNFTIRALAEYADGGQYSDTARILLDHQPPSFTLASQQRGELTDIQVISANEGELQRLAYYLNGEILGVQDAPPFGFTLPAAAARAGNLLAIAEDCAGNRNEQTLTFPR